jgi:LemA protein
MTKNRAYNFFIYSLFLLFLAGCGINDIPTYDESVKASWSQVLNQYKRRADLIPNLVNVVKGYATHERETLEAVMKARSEATSMNIPPDIINNPEAFKEFQQKQNNLSGALSRLMAVVENYPNLKANENFLALQSQLEGTENRIAVARKDYIEAVQRYNTEIRTFPGRIWAMILYRDAKAVENFTQPQEVEKAPEVKF